MSAAKRNKEAAQQSEQTAAASRVNDDDAGAQAAKKDAYDSKANAVASAGSDSPGIISETLSMILNLSARDICMRSVLVAFLTGSAIVLWKCIILFCWSEIPIVVVLSGSMEPGYYRGDLLLLASPNRPTEVGDIIVFKIKNREVPIVHRVHRMHITTNGTRRILTKGDNNFGDDVGLYNPGQFFIDEDDIMGRSICYIPYVGSLTIKMSETPYLREFVIGFLLVVVFLFNDVDT